ncbi:MAG: membrane protein insertase YidC [Candidatus Babeliales bacterium]|jgi:YidC/Oxa1 family membrane protein insertase
MDKKLLVALGLSLATVWIFNYYVAKKVPPQATGGPVAVGQQAQPAPQGQAFKVPTAQELFKPLNLTVEFAEQKLSTPEQVVTIDTDYCTATLSTYGAILTTLDFKGHPGKSGSPLRTIFNKGAFDANQRKKGCFLLALDTKTPYLYTLVDSHKEKNSTHVTFRTENESWGIVKTYIFHNDSYQVDLDLRFEPKGTSIPALKPRLFFSAPLVGEITDDKITLCAWNDEKQTLDTTDPAQAKDLAWSWQQPKPIFGAQDRYFVHTLIGDPAHFVQRAYVKQFDAHDLSSILEGPELISQQSSWKLSFYMGPKLSDHLDHVDSRLEELLSFGWLSWLCKLLLKLLSYINGFIGNFGWAIILMTILLKLPFTPLSIYSRKKTEAYQHYLPSINKIRAKYRHDLKMQNEEITKFCQDHQISQAGGLIGCLPLLIQAPILFALYRVLNNYLDLYQAPFIGWITDLSAKDPYYVTPILMGLSMLWQQKVTPPADEKQRVIMIFMALLMTVVFAGFPAGLVLYWLINNVLSIGEDYVRKYFFS